jgi:hypothetical protein
MSRVCNATLTAAQIDNHNLVGMNRPNPPHIEFLWTIRNTLEDTLQDIVFERKFTDDDKMHTG